MRSSSVVAPVQNSVIEPQLAARLNAQYDDPARSPWVVRLAASKACRVSAVLDDADQIQEPDDGRIRAILLQ